MSELPLSKFAPFTKEECHFQYEVSNKLDEIGVKCSNCIYFGEKVERPVDYSMLPTTLGEEKDMYKCDILSDKYRDGHVCENSLCRFFTNKEEIEDTTDDDRMSGSKTDEELSIAIQKLDFTNSSGVKESIKDLREKLINEDQ